MSEFGKDSVLVCNFYVVMNIHETFLILVWKSENITLLENITLQHYLIFHKGYAGAFNIAFAKE